MTITDSPANRVPTSYNREGSSPPLGAPLRRVDFVEEQMPLTDKSTEERIRELNDAFRTTLDLNLGRVLGTNGVSALGHERQHDILKAVQDFASFDSGNDPHGEHDFGSFELAGDKFFWKIDYYDSTFEFVSDDPADQEKTTRVLTLMLAAEY
jgi:Protein of unknown function (DUF3768)